jgi:regulator of sigma E protease
MSTVLGFLLTLAVLIVVHEYGHYRVAVACGVKVHRFSVGFGRVLVRWRRGPDQTEFVVCALPLGGYVRMLDEREGLVAPHEAHRAFNRQKLWKRASIVAAGPLANLLLAVVLLASAQMIGVQEPPAVLGTPAAGSAMEAAGLRAGQQVQASSVDGEQWEDLRSMPELRWRVTQAAMQGQTLHLQVSVPGSAGRHQVRVDLSAMAGREVDAALMRGVGLGAAYSEAVLGDVKVGGPAATAGLQRGDRVLSLDGRPVADAQALVEAIRASVRDGQATPQTWRVERAGQPMTLTVTPRVDRDGERSIGRVDAAVGRPLPMVSVQRGPLEALALGLDRTGEVASMTVRMLGRMLIGEASLKNLSGPLTIADYSGQAVQQGLSYYLGFLALVSISLGVLNLLPLPILDGGHLMYYIFEAVTGRPVSERWLARLQRGGVALLLMMMSVALFNDVARLLGLH